MPQMSRADYRSQEYQWNKGGFTRLIGTLKTLDFELDSVYQTLEQARQQAAYTAEQLTNEDQQERFSAEVVEVLDRLFEALESWCNIDNAIGVTESISDANQPD